MRILLCGRPNVGKSTLYNRMAVNDRAITHDVAGVTRDWREAPGRLFDLEFKLIDSAGLNFAKTNQPLDQAIQAKTMEAVRLADLLLFIIDGRTGVTEEDKSIARYLRKSGKEIIVVVNKCESDKKTPYAEEAHRLGFKTTIFISAAHGLGLSDLYEAILESNSYQQYNPSQEQESEQKDFVAEEKPKEKVISLAVLGRPNVGKSSFINKLTGSERLITSDIAGTTRDAIKISWQYKDYKFNLIDTAGIRKKANIWEDLEKLSVSQSFQALEAADVVLLIVDVTMPLEKQELKIASKIIEYGKPLIIIFNKIDLVENLERKKEEIAITLEYSIPFFRNVETLYLSVKEYHGLDWVMEYVLSLHAKAEQRIPTSLLNKWLASKIAAFPPPLMRNGNRVKLKFMMQVATTPPSFVINANRPELVGDNYRRYLINHLTNDFDFGGVPINLWFRKSDNPFETRSK